MLHVQVQIAHFILRLKSWDSSVFVEWMCHNEFLWIPLLNLNFTWAPAYIKIIFINAHIMKFFCFRIISKKKRCLCWCMCNLKIIFQGGACFEISHNAQLTPITFPLCIWLPSKSRHKSVQDECLILYSWMSWCTTPTYSLAWALCERLSRNLV